MADLVRSDGNDLQRNIFKSSDCNPEYWSYLQQIPERYFLGYFLKGNMMTNENNTQKVEPEKNPAPGQNKPDQQKQGESKPGSEKPEQQK